MCKYCDDGIAQGTHVTCYTCKNEVRWLNTSYLYDLDSNGKIVMRYTLCNPCRNLIDPKE